MLVGLCSVEEMEWNLGGSDRYRGMDSGFE